MASSVRSSIVKSMTGFAKVTASLGAVDFDVEVKSVNSRYLEINLKGLSRLGPLDREVRTIFQSLHSRGRIDIFVSRRASSEQGIAAISHELIDPLVSSYLGLCKRYGAGTAGLSQFISSLVLRGEAAEGQSDLAEEEVELLRSLLRRASEVLQESRATEGAALVGDITPRVQQLQRIGASVQQQMIGAPERIQSRLMSRLALLAPEVVLDRERLTAEVALLADRVDVSEELVRLGIHLEQFFLCLQQQGGQGIGRKLDFLTQELGRELNTIGSKAQDAIVQGLVVDAKSELEKIREQVQNIE